MTLHEFLDVGYGRLGNYRLQVRLWRGADPNKPEGPRAETPLHVAARRRRRSAVRILLRSGADVNATTTYGKTAYIHAARRGFDEICTVLRTYGAHTGATHADNLAIALHRRDMEEAQAIASAHPEAVLTGNPEENRILADMAGRSETAPVLFLLQAGADITSRGLDDGTPLHQAAWFGQPANARLLLEHEAPLEIFEEAHQSSPLGWAVHGSRFSGGARKRQAAYLTIVDMLLEAGACLHYPNDDSDTFYERLLQQASAPVRQRLRAAHQSS